MMRQQVGKFDGKYKQELNHVVLGSCDWAFGFVLKRLGHHARMKQENKGKSLVAKKVKHRETAGQHEAQEIMTTMRNHRGM